ncbi:L-2-hydroxyglutarate oxidase [Actinoplanes sp. NPDC049265]|uniref:L-2-hydroxyglutarate oxidase n=1 Tax=Actinoplanes sp. NPDC049265 TaxID=3363902 RepID=UPI003723E1CE
MDADLVVVGAGIVGLAVARELRRRRPGDSVVVVDRADRVAAHQTGHNSGVIHGGVYYPPGSLKARLCVRGARMMYEYCAAHDIPHSRCGKLIVAADDSELTRLEALEERGRANRVPGLRRITGAELTEIEPNVRGVAALHAPDTGIADFAAVARSLASELDVRLGVDVRRVDPSGAVEHAGGRLTARRVVVCAGLWSDRLAAGKGPRIVPFRGAYLRLRAPVTGHMIYPVPDPRLPFLGVHVTPHVDGHTMLGPTALLAPARDAYTLNRWRPRDLWQTATWPGTWRLGRRFWRTGLHELRMAVDRRAFVREAARYVPSLTTADLDGTVHAGVRAQALGRDGALVDDFVIDRAGVVTHVRNAPSPAATSAFALAEEIAGRVLAG